jgi:hypothetical protein
MNKNEFLLLPRADIHMSISYIPFRCNLLSTRLKAFVQDTGIESGVVHLKRFVVREIDISNSWSVADVNLAHYLSHSYHSRFR